MLEIDYGGTKNVAPNQRAKLRAPLYRLIEQDLRESLQSGKWAAGAMLPSRKSLAKEYGVDTTTIQRAVSDLIADGTLQAHRGRGTFVPTWVGTGPQGSTRASVRMVAFIANQSFSPALGWHAIICSIHENLRKHIEDCHVITIDTTSKNPEGVVRNERDALRLVQSQGMAGLIMAHAGGQSTLPDIERVIASKIPVVFIDRPPFEDGCDFVGIDNRLAAREAIEDLLGKGHRRIAFVAPDENVTTIGERLNGYVDAFTAAGVTPDDNLIFHLTLAQSLSRGGLMSEIDRVIDGVMSMPERPTAVFAINDFLALHLLLGFAEKGIQVPCEMSVMGFDDVQQFLPQKPKLTTVRQPFESIGERAASRLLWRMRRGEDNSGQYQHVLLPTRVVTGETVRPIGNGLNETCLDRISVVNAD